MADRTVGSLGGSLCENQELISGSFEIRVPAFADSVKQ